MQALELPNLRDTPFRLGVSPAEAVAHPAWLSASEGVLAALARSGRVALLGPAGSGKTLLLHAVAGALRDDGRVVRVADRGELPADLQRDAALLVDDADRLDSDALARLAGREGPCILAGPPVLAERLPPSFAPVPLQPLSPDEVARFVAARLAAAGQRRDLLEPDAVLALARLSGGVPRLINALAGSAVFLAGLDGTARVSPRHVEEAAAMRDGGEAEIAPVPAPVESAALEIPPPEQSSPQDAPLRPEPLVPRSPRRTRRPMMVSGAITALVLVCVGAVVAARHGADAPRGQEPSAAPPKPPQYAALPQQEAAPSSKPAPLPPASSEPPAAPSQPGPASAVWAPRSRPTPPSPSHDDAAVPTAEPAQPASPRVVLHYHEGAAAEADRLATALAGLGPRFSRVETRPVAGTPRAPTIRFFHPEDVGAAWELETALRMTGESWQVRNYTSYLPKPRRGTLEIWLP